MKLVIVESPAKASVIESYLGKEYRVMATYGHVRDLIPKEGSVDPNHNFHMLWGTTPQGRKTIPSLKKACPQASAILLACDPDREGEGIAWHVTQILQPVLKKHPIPVKRIVFFEITKSALTQALKEPRNLNDHLIHAYLARRALDYLVGFGISPVLWRKIPGARSAGRVQSVALRFINEREETIEDFVPEKFYTVEGNFAVTPKKKETLEGILTHIDGKKIDQKKFSKATALKAVQLTSKGEFRVKKITDNTVTMRPFPPFMTSTLQRAASNRLHFSAKRTMRTAQTLYEGVRIAGKPTGLITYMRTDAVTLSREGIHSIRDYIGEHFAPEDLPPKPNIYRSKVKNAQEAHEAIRPTKITLTPNEVAPFLSQDQLKIYTLIWERTVACQMSPAHLRKQTIQIQRDTYTFQITGQLVEKRGFLKVWPSIVKENELPPLTEENVLYNTKMEAKEHSTQPPPRYTDASLIKRLEEHGIGRPSTFGNILSLLLDRHYATLESRQYIPTPIGRVLNSFLVHFASDYVDPSFTAKMEDDLDAISRGETVYLHVLQVFWEGFHKTLKEMQDISKEKIMEVFARNMEKNFPKLGKKCPACQKGRLKLKLARGGLFLGCSAYPNCRYTESVDASPSIVKGNVEIKVGPYGPYLQERDKENPKRVRIPSGVDPEKLTPEMIDFLLQLPKNLGEHEGEPMLLGVGPYGPYVKWRTTYVSIPRRQNLREVDLAEARTLLQKHLEKLEKSRLGKHPESGDDVLCRRGRFGYQLVHGRQRIRITAEEAHSMTLDRALKFLDHEKETKKKKTVGKARKKKRTKSS